MPGNIDDITTFDLRRLSIEKLRAILNATPLTEAEINDLGDDSAQAILDRMMDSDVRFQAAAVLAIAIHTGGNGSGLEKVYETFVEDNNVTKAYEQALFGLGYDNTEVFFNRNERERVLGSEDVFAPELDADLSASEHYKDWVRGNFEADRSFGNQLRNTFSLRDVERDGPSHLQFDEAGRVTGEFDSSGELITDNFDRTMRRIPSLLREEGLRREAEVNSRQATMGLRTSARFFDPTRQHQVTGMARMGILRGGGTVHEFFQGVDDQPVAGQAPLQSVLDNRVIGLDPGDAFTEFRDVQSRAMRERPIAGFNQFFDQNGDVAGSAPTLGGLAPGTANRLGLPLGAETGQGTEFFDPVPESAVVDDGLSHSELIRSIMSMDETELEGIQRRLWQAGFFGTRAIQDGAVPQWGVLRDDTFQAWERLVDMAFLDPSSDINTVLEREIRLTAPIHEAARNAIFDSEASQFNFEPVVSAFEPLDDATERQRVRSGIEGRLGRRLTNSAVDEIVSILQREHKNAEETIHEFNVDRADEAALDAVREFQQGVGTQGGGSRALDDMGRPIGDVGPARAFTGFLPQGAGNLDPSEGLTEENLQAVLRAIRWTESGSPDGKYDARNGKSSAGGAYQFVDATWVGAGGSTVRGGGGRGNGLASYASREEQDRIARNYVINLYNRYGNFRDVFKAWFLPAWIGTRDDEIVPGHNHSLNSYSALQMDRAFGRQSQQLGTPGVRGEMSVWGAVDAASLMGLGINQHGETVLPDGQNITNVEVNDDGQPLLTQGAQVMPLLPGQQSGTKLLQVPTSLTSADLNELIEHEAQERFGPELEANRAGDYLGLLMRRMGGVGTTLRSSR